jgi:hypothetical protein
VVAVNKIGIVMLVMNSICQANTIMIWYSFMVLVEELIGVIRECESGLARHSFSARLHKFIGLDRRGSQNPRQLGDSSHMEGVEQLERCDVEEMNHSLGLTEQPCSSGDCQQ